MVTLTNFLRGAWTPTARRTTAVLAAVTCLAVVSSAIPAAARADAGVEGLSHAGTGTPTGTKRAESVLWNNDGLWWGNLWDTAGGDFHIFRLDTATQQWVDTGTPTDTRANIHSDVLWTGSKLYVSSHLFVNDGQPAVSGFPSRLYRYSYNPLNKQYTLDSGFPTQINDMRTETLTVDRDSTGKLWATWQQNNQIFVNSTTGNDVWGTPAPIPGANVTIDDTSALIAFNGGMLAMWSDQSGGPDNGMHFAIHAAGGTHTSGWGQRRAVITGPGTSDDHMNLKWLESDGGRIFAATKTSKTAGADPLLLLLVLDTRAAANPSQEWQSYTISRVSECPNRVIVLIDKANSLLRTFATYPDPNANVCSSSGGAIYEKDSPLPPQGSAAYSFPAGRGTLRIADTSVPFVHNVSSTKQNVSAADGGLAVIADNGRTSRYWHYYDPLGATPPTDNTPPNTTINSAPPATATATTASFTFSSTETGSTFACKLDGGAFTACTSPASYSGLAAGSHTFAVRATDAAGNTDPTEATYTWTISPTANTPPDTAIDSGPTGTVTETTASFAFSSTEAGSTFACKLDGSAFESCTSPKSYSGLATGSHTFDVKAIDSAGAEDPSPASRTWTIGTAQPPAGTIERESSIAVDLSVSSNSLAITKPTGTGGLLVACITLTAGTVNTDTGWTQIAAVTGAGNPRVFGFYKVAAASDPASFAFGLSTATTGAGGIARFSGASGVDGSATTASSSTAATSGTLPAVTTTAANAQIVGCTGVNSSSTSITPAAGLSEAWDLGTRRSEFADGAQPTAGASGAKTFTFSASRAWAGWLVALRPG
jgi:hypothetical protein